MNGVPSMQSYLSRFAISRKVSAWTNSKLIIAAVAKLTFDLLPEQPSCNVTGLSSARGCNSATLGRDSQHPWCCLCWRETYISVASMGVSWRESYIIIPYLVIL